MHGTDGPLHVQEVRDKRPMDDVFLKAMNQAGIPSNPDFNGVDQTGCGYYQFTQNNGRRWSTASAYLTPARSAPISPSLPMQSHSVFCSKAKRLPVSKGRRGQKQVIQGAHVILSGGAVASPQLLEVSGAGDGERLQAIGVDVVHHAPDVGEHLQDHILCKVVYATQPENSINREVQGLRLIPAALRWFFLREGPLTTGSAPWALFAIPETGWKHQMYRFTCLRRHALQ